MFALVIESCNIRETIDDKNLLVRDFLHKDEESSISNRISSLVTPGDDSSQQEERVEESLCHSR